MTNYRLIEEAVWNAARSNDRIEFDQQCKRLRDKAEGDIWRIGWSINPKTIDELVELFEKVAKAVNEMWVKAIECGDAPPEDVSPAEGFQHCADLIKTVKK